MGSHIMHTRRVGATMVASYMTILSRLEINSWEQIVRHSHNKLFSLFYVILSVPLCLCSLSIPPDWVRAGGIAGRGILLDYVHYCETHNKLLPKANSPYPITIQELDEIAEAENVEFQVGDILFMRTGFTRWYKRASDEERKYTFSCSENARFIGLAANTESRDWLWNHHFAAVAGDTFGFEGTNTPFIFFCSISFLAELTTPISPPSHVLREGLIIDIRSYSETT